MSKKVGPFPLWAWLVVAAVGGYIIYRMRAAQSAAPAPEVEGYYPAQRAEPNEGGGSTGGAGGGVAALGEEIGALRDAGFVPAGSEEAKGEPPERAQAPAWWEELAEGLIKERLAPRPGGGGKRGGRGKTGKRGKRGATSGKRARHNRNPRHTHQPAHTPSRHPKTRIGGGPGRPARPARPRKRRRR